MWERLPLREPWSHSPSHGAAGVDFGLTGEEKLFRDSVREFAQRHIAPAWERIDEEGRIPPQLIKRMAEQGLFAIPVPEEAGGLGGRFLEAAIAVEEIAYADPAVATAVFTLLNNGWPALAARMRHSGEVEDVIRRVASGDAFLGIASTEPSGGSDVAGESTRAEQRPGGGYSITGEKIFISGVEEVMKTLPWGGGWVLIARTSGSPGDHRGLTLFLAHGRAGGDPLPGIEYSRLDTIGRHGLSTGILRFNGYTRGEEHIIGERDKGFYAALQGFNMARILVAAATIGSARWALDFSKQWLRERRLFGGRPLASFQGVSFRYAELETELEAARLLVYKAAWLADKIYTEGDPLFKPSDLNKPSAMAKLKAPQVAIEVYTEAMKWHGALAYTKDLPLYRGWLGVASYVIGAEGAQNIMKYIVARESLGKEAVKA